MASSANQFVVTLVAGENLARYRAVTLNTPGNAGTAVYVATNNDTVVGVTTEAADSGDPVSVQILGIAKIECGANVVAGQYVFSQTDGQAQAADTVANDHQGMGKALEGGSSGEIISMLLVPQAAT